MKIGTTKAFSIAVAIHLLLIIALVVNVSLDKPERPQDAGSNLMHATIVTPPAKGKPTGKALAKPQASQNTTKTEESKSEAVVQAQKELQERVAMQQKQEEARAKAVEAKQKQEALKKAQEKKALALKKAQEQKKLEEQKKAEAKKKAEAEAKKKAEAEAKKKAEVEAKKKAEAEAKKKAEVEAKKKAEAEAKKKAEVEAKKKAEAEAKRKAEAEAKRKAAASSKADSLEEDILGTEDGDPVNGKGLGSGPSGASDGYGAKIQGMIESNWYIDPSMNGKTVKVSINVGSDGIISDEQCQGDAKVCKSAIDALKRIGMLPAPPANCPECGNIVISMTPKL